MNSDFPRIMTLLRKERGISQKQAAMELGVSQALLSHYEKGIRECGLDFVVKIADYYQVSCDYLLGRTVERTGYSDSLDKTVVAAGQQAQENQKPSALLTLNKKLILDSLTIIFQILEQADHKGLTSEVSSYFMVSVYKMLRAVYSANTKNPQAMFSVIPELHAGVSAALQSVIAANISCLVSGKPTNGFDAVSASAAPSLSPEIISRKHPDLAPSLYNLIRDIEEKMKSLL